MLSNSDKKNIEQAAAGFVTNVAGRDIGKAKEISTGMVLFNLSGMEQTLSKKHLVLDTKAQVLAWGPAWAVAKVKVESISPANETSVHWYEMQLVKEDGWKVYKLKETGPDIKNGRTSPADKEKCEETFWQFGDALLSGRYADAGKHLIGQAKNAHEMSAGMFKDVLIGKSGLKDLSTSIMAGDGQNLVLKIVYSLDGKQNRLAVSFHKMKGGWKIFDISQV